MPCLIIIKLPKYSSSLPLYITVPDAADFTKEPEGAKICVPSRKLFLFRITVPLIGHINFLLFRGLASRNDDLVPCVPEFVLPAAELLDFLVAADVAAVTAVVVPVVVDFPAALEVVVAGLAAGFPVAGACLEAVEVI